MRNYHKKNKIVVTLIILLIVILIIGILGYLYISNKENKLKERISDINSHFNQIVITNKISAIYDKEYNKVGTIEKGVLLSLKEQEIYENTKYFTIDSLDEEYYIDYDSVDKSSESLPEKETRYKRYIPFNQNVKSDSVSLYKDGNLIYTFNKEMSLPIYIKEDNEYYVEYNNELYEVKKNEVEVI